MGKTKSKVKSTRKPIYQGDPNTFDVDCILKKRIIGEKTEYFIKWLGYPESENSWVDESDVTPDLIKSFNLMTKRAQSNARQSRQTPDLQTNESSPNFEMYDSYFEEGLHNSGINVQLCSTTENFQLFSSPDVLLNEVDNEK